MYINIFYFFCLFLSQFKTYLGLCLFFCEDFFSFMIVFFFLYFYLVFIDFAFHLKKDFHFFFSIFWNCKFYCFVGGGMVENCKHFLGWKCQRKQKETEVFVVVVVVWSTKKKNETLNSLKIILEFVKSTTKWQTNNGKRALNTICHCWQLSPHLPHCLSLWQRSLFIYLHLIIS